MGVRTLVLVMVLSGVVGAGEQRVYIAPDDHTDYWWSADEETYRQAFLDTIDYYLDAVDDTEHHPTEHQSRWNCDGSFWMWTYEKHRSAAEFERLIERIRDGHISVPLNALCVCLGGAPAEAILRGMYYPGLIERRFNMRFRLAYMIENQTQPLGLWSLWRGSGARFSWKGICGCDTRVADAGRRPHEIFRGRGLDGSEMLVKWYSMPWGNQSIGGYAEARHPGKVIDRVSGESADRNFRARYPYDVIGCFGKGWDDVKTMTMEFVKTAIAKTTADRKVIVSNEEDFFHDFESTYGTTTLPVVSSSFGNEWDLYCASLAETSARIKRAIEKLRAAEAMAAVICMHDGDFMKGRAKQRATAWMNLGLFWEHDFGMVGPPTGSRGVAGRIRWQQRLADEIDQYVEALHEEAGKRLADLIDREGSTRRIMVFNPLSWKRTDVAEVSWEEKDPVHVIDVESGATMRSQIITRGKERRLRMLVVDVPAVGYKIYEIVPGAGKVHASAATVIDGASMQNDRYRIMVNGSGSIISWKDLHRGGVELVRTIGGRAVNDLGGTGGVLKIDNAGPVSVTLRAESTSPVAHTTHITMHHGLDRIDIHNEITQNFKSTLVWDFGFSLREPRVRHEEVGAILHARRLADGGHYADANARYDWLTLNHFADMCGADEIGITLSNADCYFMKLGKSTVTSLDVKTPQLRVLAGGRVANGTHGLPAQGGSTHFLQRFALRAHRGYDPVAAMKFSLEHQNPLVCRRVRGNLPVLPPKRFSAVSLTDPRVLLWAFKPAEEGMARGLIARLWNISESSQTTTLQLSQRPVRHAIETSHIETDESPLGVKPAGITTEFNPQQMRTFRLVPASMHEEPPKGQ